LDICHYKNLVIIYDWDWTYIHIDKNKKSAKTTWTENWFE